MDNPRIFNITESAHRIHNPITPEKLATLGAALRLESGDRVRDLGSGSAPYAMLRGFRFAPGFQELGIRSQAIKQLGIR